METSAIQTQSVYPQSSSKPPVEKISYRSDSLTYDYKSKDGDTVHLEYSSTQLSVLSGRNDETAQTSKKPYLMDPEEAARFRSQLKNELESYKSQLIQSIGKPAGTLNIPTVLDTASQDPVAALEALMPEYWNADNTSQRIVDFATSFLSAFKGADSEFFKQIKAAIEDGFKQAGDALGEIPGPVGDLMKKTHDMTMDKLDKIERELAGGASQQSADAAPQSFSAVA